MRAKLLILCMCIFAIGLCGCYEEKTVEVKADVLTVNSEILEGELIGHFLGSSDGWIKSDVIKVGVKFEINGHIFLEDLKLSHAQLAYFKDRKVLPLRIDIYKQPSSVSRIEIKLCGYYIKLRYISTDVARTLMGKIQ